MQTTNVHKICSFWENLQNFHPTNLQSIQINWKMKTIYYEVASSVKSSCKKYWLWTFLSEKNSFYGSLDLPSNFFRIEYLIFLMKIFMRNTAVLLQHLCSCFFFCQHIVAGDQKGSMSIQWFPQSFLHHRPGNSYLLAAPWLCLRERLQKRE